MGQIRSSVCARQLTKSKFHTFVKITYNTTSNVETRDAFCFVETLKTVYKSMLTYRRLKIVHRFLLIAIIIFNLQMIF